MTIQTLIDALSTVEDKNLNICFNEANEHVVLYVHEFEVVRLSNDELVLLLSGF